MFSNPPRIFFFLQYSNIQRCFATVYCQKNNSNFKPQGRSIFLHPTESKSQAYCTLYTVLIQLANTLQDLLD